MFGKLEHGGTVKVVVEGKGEDRKLTFEFLAPDPTKRAKGKAADDDDDGDDDDEPQTVLVDAAPRKALPSPKERKERPPKASGGAVPTVPRRKDE